MHPNITCGRLLHMMCLLCCALTSSYAPLCVTCSLRRHMSAEVSCALLAAASFGARIAFRHQHDRRLKTRLVGLGGSNTPHAPLASRERNKLPMTLMLQFLCLTWTGDGSSARYWHYRSFYDISDVCAARIPKGRRGMSHANIIVKVMWTCQIAQLLPPSFWQRCPLFLRMHWISSWIYTVRLVLPP